MLFTSSIVLGIVTSLARSDPRLSLIAGVGADGILGVVCLGSLLAPRPLLFVLGREFSMGGDRARMAEFDRLWQRPHFRFVNRMMTIVWGVSYLVVVGIRAALTNAIDPKIVAIVAPLLSVATTLALLVWMVAYANRAGRHGERMLERNKEATA